jgi:hypothetical protein
MDRQQLRDVKSKKASTAKIQAQKSAAMTSGGRHRLYTFRYRRLSNGGCPDPARAVAYVV